MCFCSDGRQVRLVSFFVSSLFVPDAERAIVLAWRGMLTVRVTHGAERGPHAGLVIELCTEGLGGEQGQKAWDQLVESDGGDLEGSIVPDIAIEGVLYDVKTVAATTEHYAPHHIEHYAKMERKRGNAPVDRRARLVNGQYLKKAHRTLFGGVCRGGSA